MTLEENLTRISFVALLNAKVREQYPIVFKDLDERFNAFESALKQELRALGWNG
jgi:ABC-type thiamine transport system ATPase subunit